MTEFGSGKGRGVMANRTILGGWDMAQRHTSRPHAVMAGSTVTDDTIVIEYGRGKTAGHVADPAVLAGHNVAHILSGSGNAMAGIASSTHDIRAIVVDIPADKSGRVVTRTAV